ncbi:MAG: hypothetical protein A3J24_04700 [Deltaproteobacteria bacterium RIFCSPLOWO2_02_FULL_53_8]|nr:MAG: hypothetical protein A3J24_04700 [Deltaproteobacteria bacterium RIFCSPLOWO2_02_FULL_53_8]
MVTQINPKSSVATDVALGPLVAAKPQSVQEPSRPAKVADTVPSKIEERPDNASGKDLDTAVKEVREHLMQSGSKLEIQYDKASGRNVFKIVDSGTGGVVLQIPSEEILAMARKLRETANAQDPSGVLVDKEG